MATATNSPVRQAKQSLLHNCFLILFLIFSTNGSLFAQCPTLIWSDEFDGSAVDETKWSFQNGDGCDLGPNLCGWGNNELQWYQPANAVVSDGVLKLIAKRENVNNRFYTSARLRSKDKGDWTYGRFEARMKLPKGKGLWPAFWMLSTDEKYGGWPKSGEIDIAELIGSEPAAVHGTIHYGLEWPNNQSKGVTFNLKQEIFNDNFHTFAVEWENGRIRWYVDDFLYSTKTKSDIAPYQWPFDQDFHLLLNLAVGGNWPGSPDGSTVFPQALEVDYVRVYDGYFPSINGEREVAQFAKNVSYYVGNAPAGATFAWTVPEGATIVSGQGTNAIKVDWGQNTGDVVATVTSDCGSRELRLTVAPAPVFLPALTLENFDSVPAKVTYTSSTGTFVDDTANPAANEVNSSDLCGKYQRNASQQYDVFVYQTSALGNANVFTEGTRKFFLDVYTDAPTNTEVLLQLEQSSRATPTNYPTGRHSRYTARTTKRNEWERLEFELLDRPDPSTPGTAVNQIIFLFASNSSNGSTYYFDNFEIYEKAIPTGIGAFGPRKAASLRLFPNPAGSYLQISNTGRTPVIQVEIFDLQGRSLRREPVSLPAEATQELKIGELPSGTYLLRVLRDNGSVEALMFSKE